MPQEFHALQCYNCNFYQVDIVKKVLKWSCKVCGEKQSLRKIFTKGSAKDCRLIVQDLNEKRIQIENQALEHIQKQICVEVEESSSTSAQDIWSSKTIIIKENTRNNFHENNLNNDPNYNLALEKSMRNAGALIEKNKRNYDLKRKPSIVVEENTNLKIQKLSQNKIQDLSEMPVVHEDARAHSPSGRLAGSRLKSLFASKYDDVILNFEI